jgi:peptidoglycan-associated lipoprotein
MKTKQCAIIIFLVSLTSLLTTGCKSKNSNSNTVWDDNQTMGNYKGTAANLWNKVTGNTKDNVSFFGPNEEDFVALNDDDLKKMQFSDGAVPQPKIDPGSRGSSVPGIEGFRKPSGELAAIFKNIHFNTDDHIVRDKESLALIERAADYLKSHGGLSIFIEGHCDERGPEAYNLSLGSRRANYIRSLLVQKGVDPERLFTISYGKERLIDLSNTPQAWSKNRRAEFKVFKKT